jgi:hypothetical protein
MPMKMLYVPVCHSVSMYASVYMSGRERKGEEEEEKGGGGGGGCGARTRRGGGGG